MAEPMKESSSNRFTEPTIIGTVAEARQYASQAGAPQKASAHEPKSKRFIFDNFQMETDKASEEQQKRREQEPLYKEYSLPWSHTDVESPFPGLKLNGCNFRWEPENLEEFIREHGEEFKRFKNARLTNQSGNQAVTQSEPQSDESSATSTTDTMVQPKQQCTGTTVAPPKGNKSPSKSATRAKSATKPKGQAAKEADSKDALASAEVIAVKPPEPSVEAPTAEPMEQPKKPRTSAKMINENFDELSRDFLHIVSLGEKKPVFIPLDLRNALETLARLSGVPNLAPSHIVINILRVFFNEHRELINRKLSCVKLSI